MVSVYMGIFMGMFGVLGTAAGLRWDMALAFGGLIP